VNPVRARSVKRAADGEQAVCGPGGRWYWAAEVDLAAQRIWIDPEETRHLRTVLRHRAADSIEVIDGRGGRYTVALASRVPALGRRGAGRGLEGRILAVHPLTPEPAPLVLAVPCIKWPRLEILVDGAVQLGVTHFHLWHAEQSNWQAELSPSRSRRLERIAREATTQSLGTHAPVITGPLALPALLAALANPLARGEAWVAHLAPDDGGGSVPSPAGDPAGSASTPQPSAGLALVIGPEGGLTPAEVATFQGAGARLLYLGPRRLRTEVAAIAGLAALLDRGRGSASGPIPAR
jgi:16S rRNA (uracil1498-N3)-methyltransferase